MPGVLRPMLWLAMPVLLEQVLTTLVGFVDVWLTGNFITGEAPMAAIGLMAYALWLLPNMFASVAIGCTALVSRYVGANKPRLASRVTNQAFLCGSVLAVIALALAHYYGNWFVAMMNLHDEAGKHAMTYLALITPIIPFLMIERVGIAALRGAGDTISGFVAMSVVNIVNLCASAAFVTGWGPFPELGFRGLALGTAIGHAFGGTIILLLLVMGRAGLQLRFRWLRPHGSIIQRLLKIGIPGGADVLTINGCHLWFLGIVNGLGTLAAASHSLAIRIESIAYLPGGAFQVAATTMAGQYLGANDRKRAMQGVMANFVAGGSIMVLMGLLFFFGADGLTSFFTGAGGHEERTAANLDMATAAQPLLRMASFAMPSLAATMIFSGALRGAGDTRWPFLYTMIGMIGVRIPFALLLAPDQLHLPLLGHVNCLGLGVIGAWYAMVGDILLRSLLITTRYLRGRWLDTIV